MLTCNAMRGFPHVPLIFLLVLPLASGCNTDSQPDPQAEWIEVLRHKAAAVAPDAAVEQKQIYADALREFVQRHPGHDRGKEVWLNLQLTFADDLASAGRHQEAIRLYKSVLTFDEQNEAALRGLAIAADRLAVTREKLLEIEKGMSEEDVVALLGRPAPGWTANNSRPEATIVAWYYQTRSGGVAGVYFRDGVVFAAEEDSSAPLARLGS